MTAERKVPPLAFAWLTAGARETLTGSIESFLGNLGKYGDRSPCLLAVDGPLSALDSRLAGKLGHIARDSGHHFRVSDRAARDAFLKNLPEAYDREAVRYALIPERAGQGAGSNRNAIMLAGAGGIIVSTDDDVFCAPAVLPDHKDGVGQLADSVPAECRYYPDRETLLKGIRPAEIDVAAVYRSLFFRPPGKRSPDDTPADGSSACAGSGSGKSGPVLVVSPGCYGNSGFSVARTVLSLEGGIRAQFHGFGYERMRYSHEMVRIPARDLIGSGSFVMTGQAAFDVRNPLPPFFPVGRPEDRFFSLLLHILHPGSRTAYPSFGYLHDPGEQRPLSRENLTGFKPCLAELMMSISISGVPPPAITDPAERFAAVGTHFRKNASLATPDFVGMLHDTWSGSAIAFAEKLEELLERYDRTPVAWAADVGELLKNVYAQAREPSLLFGKSGCGYTAEEVRHHVGMFGRLLCQWPGLLAWSAEHEPAGLGLTAEFGKN